MSPCWVSASNPGNYGIDFDGITGKITLDEKRNANKSAVVLTIKDGKFSFVESLAP